MSRGMHLLCALIFTLLVVNGACTISGSDNTAIIHEERSGIDRLSQKRRVSNSSVIPVRIALKQQNLHEAERALLDVADPVSINYGRHWTQDQVIQHFSPSKASINVVKEWLTAVGVQAESIHHSANKAWLAFDLPAVDAERLFKTAYYEYEGPHDGTIRLTCDAYSLPLSIRAHIDYIVPGVTPSQPVRRSQLAIRPRRSRRVRTSSRAAGIDVDQTSASANFKRAPAIHLVPAELRNCSKQITPDCIRALYDIPKGYLNDTVNSLGIFEAQIYFAQADLDRFYESYAPYISNGTTPDVVVVDDAIQPPLSPNTTLGLTESTIDLDMAFSLICPQMVTYYQVSPDFGNQTIKGGDGFIQASLNFLDALDGSYCTENESAAGNQCGTVSATRVISISYDTPEINRTSAFQRRQCYEFMKLALQGHTIIAASGDFGVGSVPPNSNSNGCIAADGLTLADNGTIFSPGYPQNCPYVLSVGGTQLNSNASVYDAESALHVTGLAQTLGYNRSFYSSSGGFSNVFPRPSWQDNAVLRYLGHHDPGYPFYTLNGSDTASAESNVGDGGGLYNRAGRAYPDVSANGANFATFIKGNFTLEYGTSLAAPLWASILTLINEERTAVGKGPVGFVQPVLYKYAHLLNDITNGTNPGCSTPGFSAVTGWDPVTGLGTPNYPDLLDVFMKLP